VEAFYMDNLGNLAQDISILHRQYYKDTGNDFKKLDLNPTATCILLTVNDHPNINQQEISERLVIDKSLTAREINRMQKLNYLDKGNGKGKSVTINLTDLGRSLMPQLRHIRQQWWTDKFAETGIDANSPLMEGIQTIVEHVTGYDNQLD
jgi:DNA-binding MarR family transcriptional regulator